MRVILFCERSAAKVRTNCAMRVFWWLGQVDWVRPFCLTLPRRGVGTIGVIDDDIVSLSNLQRQVLFNEDQLDMPKVFAGSNQSEKTEPVRRSSTI